MFRRNTVEEQQGRSEILIEVMRSSWESILERMNEDPHYIPIISIDKHESIILIPLKKTEANQEKFLEV